MPGLEGRVYPAERLDKTVIRRRLLEAPYFGLLRTNGRTVRGRFGGFRRGSRG